MVKPKSRDMYISPKYIYIHIYIYTVYSIYIYIYTHEFEELINQWANTAEGQALDGTGLWVAQIGRYSFTDGEWTKHHQILKVPSVFNLPVTQDGNTTKTEQFSVVGFLCHSGTAHKSGNFYAAFCYRGLLWLVDDESFPRPIQCMHDTMRMQIVQVWAVPSTNILPTDIPSDIPLSLPESDIQQHPKRRCLAGTGFSFANVTQLGQQVRQWLVGRERNQHSLWKRILVRMIMTRPCSGLLHVVLEYWAKQLRSAPKEARMEA